MLGRLCSRILLLVCLFASGWVQAVELNAARYDIYVGQLDANGDPDFYFHGKPLTIILHGDIATPIVLPAPPSFAVFQNRLESRPTYGGSYTYNNSHGYYNPEPYSLSASGIAAKGLVLYREGIDFFNGDFNGDGRRDWLLRGASESQTTMILTGTTGDDLPVTSHQYRGVNQLPHNLSDRSLALRIEDVNEDGQDDVTVVASSAKYADVVYLSTSGGIPEEYSLTNTVPDIAAPTLVGSTAGKFRVDESGAATYSIPLSMPRGSGGVAPQLSLNYSSQGGNGLLGQGWSLGGLSSISRCRQTLSQDGVAKPITWGAGDRFCLDGQRLVLYTGSTYGAVGATYKTAIDSFVTVTSHGGSLGAPDYFTIRRKDGSLTHYGETIDARHKLPGEEPVRVISWLQNRFEDSVDVNAGMGNRIEFSYEGDYNSGHRLSQIRYAFGSSADIAAVTVDFDYEGRPDILHGYQGGVLLTVSQRLGQITVTDTQSNGTAAEVRRYELRYQKVANDGLHRNTSKLAAIQECVVDKCLPATQFEWANQSLGFSSLLSGSIDLPNPSDDRYLKSYLPADINGDGNLDLVYLELVPSTDGNGVHRLYYGISDGTHIVSTTSVSSYLGPLNAKTAIAVLDYNVDGRQDIAFYKPGSTGHWNIYLSSPQSDGSWSIDNTAITTPITDAKATFVDFDSNGLVDAVSATRYWMLERDDSQPETSTHAYHFGEAKYYSWTALDPLPDPIGNCGPIYETKTLLTTKAADFNGNGSVDFIGYREKTMYCTMGGYGGPTRAVYALYSDNGTLRQYDLLPFGWSTPLSTIQVADINGDGFSDIFYKDGTAYHYMLNNGSGFNSPVLFGELPSGVDPAITDYNGDGAADIYWNDTTSRELTVHLWAGAEFGPARVIRHDTSSRQKDSHIFMDMNGDGQPDYVHVSSTRMNTFLGHTLPEGQAPNSIVGITNGLGSYTDVNYGTLGRSGHYTRMDINATTTTHTQTVFPAYCSYTSSPTMCGPREYTYETTDASDFYKRLNGGWELPEGSVTKVPENTHKDYPALEFIGAMYVVTNVASISPSAGSAPGGVNHHAHSEISYYYGEAKLQASGRGFLGFHKLKTVDEQSGIATTTTYRQDYPFIGRPLSTEVYSSDDENGVLLSRAYNTWNFKVFDGKRYQPYLEKSIEQRFGLKDDGATQGELLQTVTTDQTYDNYGNPTKTIITTSASGETPRTQTTENTYGTSASDIWGQEMGRLSFTKVTTTEGTRTLIRESAFKYYPEGDAHEGLLQQEIIEPNDPVFKLTTEYAYDDFGNKEKRTQKAPGETDRISFVYHDALGRYVTSRKNALGQIIEMVTQRHFTGAPEKVEDINNVVTTIVYDALGREVQRFDETGAWSTSQYELCSFGCPLGAQYSIEQKVSGGGESVEYFDALGRSLRKSHVGFGGQWIYVNTEYDNRGRLKFVSNPYFAGDVPSGWTEHRYDLLGRGIEIIKPDGTSGGTTRYEGFDTIITNALAQRKTETRNAKGELIEVLDHLGGTVSYEYDLAGNLLSAVTTDAVGGDSVRVSMCYDKLGRKIAMHDPDKGGFVGNADATCATVMDTTTPGWWYYGYTGFGELETQVDAKRQTRSMTYDALGRMHTRTDKSSDNSVESHTRWYYDKNIDGQSEIGRLGNITRVVQSDSVTDETCGTGNYCATYYYDEYGRQTDQTVFHPDADTGYSSGVEYDNIGRPFRHYDAMHGLVMPSSGSEQHYNNYGYKDYITDLASGDVLSKILETNARGQVTQELRGNGATTTYTYDTQLGHLTRQEATIVGILPLQDITYDWDTLGNLRSRHNQSLSNSGGDKKNLQESFCYDGLNRLIKTYQGTLNGSCSLTPENQDVIYDGLGNITDKGGVGGYAYGINAGPHAVTSAGGASYTYDHNGNMVSGDGRNLIYSTFDKPILISRDGHTTEFHYGPDRSRYKRMDTSGTNITTTTLYLGNVERIHEEGGTTVTWRRAVAGAVYITTTDLTNQVQGSADKSFAYKDHLGSTDVITDEVGTVTQSQSFDAWGQRRNAETWQLLGPTELLAFDASITKRGYTGHEQIDETGLIHMNGRVYDPKIARFLQADPFIQAASNTQSYNRYSYLWNNPLNATDPSGYFLSFVIASRVDLVVSRPIFKYLADNPGLATFVQIAGAAISTVYCGPCSIGFSAQFSKNLAYAQTGSLNAAYKSAAISGASAAAFYGIGGAYANGGINFAEKVMLHAMVGGITAELQGGKFGHGFAAAGFTALSSWGSTSTGKGPTLDGVIKASIVGGTASVITGGKFANGAVTGAFSYIFNDSLHAQEGDGFFSSVWKKVTEWHFEGRAAKNSGLPTYEEAIGEGSNWQLLKEAQSVFHDDGIGKHELKFINPDGREVVFNGDSLNVVIRPRYVGTYNYVNPAPVPSKWYNVVGWGAWAGKGVGHLAVDVIPYGLGGNVRGEY